MPRTPLETLLDRFESDAPWSSRHREGRSLGEAFSALNRASMLRCAEPLDAWWCDACSEPHPVALSGDDRSQAAAPISADELGDVAVPTARTEQIAISVERFAEICLRALTSERARLRRRERDWLWEADLDGEPLRPPVYLARDFYEPVRWELLRRHLTRSRRQRLRHRLRCRKSRGSISALPPPLELRWLGDALVLDGRWPARSAGRSARRREEGRADREAASCARSRSMRLFEELIADGRGRKRPPAQCNGDKTIVFATRRAMAAARPSERRPHREPYSGPAQ